MAQLVPLAPLYNPEWQKYRAAVEQKAQTRRAAEAAYASLEEMGLVPDPLNRLVCEFAYGCVPRRGQGVLHALWQKLRALLGP